MTFLGPTVFCMNLRFGLADDAADGWHKRGRIVAQLLNEYSADFYAFQEVNDFQAKDLQANLVQYGMIGQRHPAPDGWQNNLIFYRPDWHCTASDHFYLSHTPDVPSKFENSKWPRQCTMGSFTKAGQSLIFITTHFDFDTRVQEKSSQVILSRLKTLPTGTPSILTGDFNATPEDRCYQIFTGTLTDANIKASDRMDQPVFKNVFKPPYPSTHHGFTGDAQSGLIDWILYRGGLKLKDAGIITDTFDGRYPSDHFPLIARFEWGA